MGLLVTYIVLALVVSFTCSLLESVILSTTHAYIGLLVKEGRHSGAMLRRMKKNIDHPLAAILTLNTVANTIGAAGVGAQVFHLFGSQWVALASALLTLSILVFSEIIPKTIGAAYWKQVAPYAAYVLRALILLLYPFVRILQGISRLISKGGGGQGHITREELIVMAEVGERAGVLLPKETRIIENLLLLGELFTGDILTPRSVLLAVKIDSTIGEVVERHTPIRFSRIPVIGDSMDDIRGVILKDELIEAHSSGRSDETVEQIIHPLHAVPDSKTISDLLDEFINRREHIFLVIDEYGGTAGIVTLEDVIETLLGVEIMDEFDYIEDMRAYALERWKKRRKNWVL